MSRQLPDAETLALEREISAQVVMFVRRGLRTAGLSAEQARAARRLVLEVGSFWELIRVERRWEEHGFGSYAEAMGVRYEVQLSDALRVIKAARRLQARSRGRS